MNEAIKLAIEKGGYKAPNPWNVAVVEGDLYTFGEKFHEGELERLCVLDPLFWQALSKALGQNQCNCGKPVCSVREWDSMAHTYFDLVLTGGDTEKFWKDLLK